MNNNEISKIKLSTEILGTNEAANFEPSIILNSKRKDTAQMMVQKLNSNDAINFNQFTFTSFNTFKSNKANFNKKIEQINPNYDQKDNLGFLTKNYWATDLRNNLSPTRLSKGSIPTKFKSVINSNSSKVLNKLK